jgi:Raf kinase inhibitor-like YbhB/YbcL family protein
MKLTSTAFKHNSGIPRIYTCEGRDISPPLAWEEPPAATRSFALIVDDPDAPDPAAPKTTWVHWVIYNLPAHCQSLPEDVRMLPGDGLDGTNNWNRTGYGGPCPPVGRHRYFFKLYALDTELPALHSPSKDKLLEAMKGHVIGQAELIGTYRKGDGAR